MNSIGAMSSPVKQPMPTVLAPPSISNSSSSKVQQPPNLTPLNLNTTSQTAQPLSLVNDHKLVPIVIPPPVMSSVENIVQKSTSCNGIPDVKPIGEKFGEAVQKIDSQIPHNQVINSVNDKNATELSISGVKSEVENLSQKKDDKNILPISQTDKILSDVGTSVKDTTKPGESTKSENLTAKSKENDTKINQELIEVQAVVQTNQGQTASPEKIEQIAPNTSKGAVRRKREHKVSFINLVIIINSLIVYFFTVLHK